MPDTDEDDDTMTVPDAARALGITIDEAYQRIRIGTLPAVRSDGDVYRIPAAAVRSEAGDR